MCIFPYKFFVCEYLLISNTAAFFATSFYPFHTTYSAWIIPPASTHLISSFIQESNTQGRTKPSHVQPSDRKVGIDSPCERVYPLIVGRRHVDRSDMLDSVLHTSTTAYCCIPTLPYPHHRNRVHSIYPFRPPRGAKIDTRVHE